MIISVFSDGAKKDKVAEFYDCKYPTSFLRGVLEETQEDEEETELTFVCRNKEEVKAGFLGNVIKLRVD